MYKLISERLTKIARALCADYADTQQFVYTMPGLNQVSDISYDVLHGSPGQRQSDPSSRKTDEKSKYDTLRLGPGPNQTDSLDPIESPTFSNVGIPGDPKTDEQGLVRDTTKPRGEPDQDSLNRDTYHSEGLWDSQEYV